MELTSHQREQLAIATSARVGILTGSAGTGKSFTTSEFLKGFSGGYQVCCPTGKAAARLQAEGIPATTIHTMLCPGRSGHDKGGWGFLHNENYPLQASLIVVDEAFMVGTELMSDLLRAVTPGTRMLFVGDPNQLPPVGHGRPVFDMLESQVVPHGHLSELHRFAGRIARVANSIKDSKPWSPSDKVDLDSKPAENLRHIEAATSQSIIETLPKLLETIREKWSFDPIEDIQVVCALNEKSSLARKSLNPLLQQLLNPNGDRDESGAIAVRVGDKLMCLKNHTRTVIDKKDDDDPFESEDGGDEPDADVYIANGEIGRVVKTLRTKDRKKATAVEAVFCGKRVKITRDGLSEFDLSYAATCHKLQGSQAPVVIVLADDAATQVASRAWWYTAITRAAKLCVTIGKRSTILSQCHRVDLQNRKTFLREVLSERCRRNATIATTSNWIEDL